MMRPSIRYLYHLLSIPSAAIFGTSVFIHSSCILHNATQQNAMGATESCGKCVNLGANWKESELKIGTFGPQNHENMG